MPEPLLDEDMMKRFLLGELPETERARLEERALCDEETSSLLGSVEDDLVDAYVLGELPARRRAAFERLYLASHYGRGRLANSRALLQACGRRRAAVSAPASRGTVRSAITRILGIRFPAQRFAISGMAAALVVVVVAVAWMLRGAPTGGLTGEITLTLAADATRSGRAPAELRLTGEDRPVTLLLDLEGSEGFEKYDVIVREADGVELLRRVALTSGRREMTPVIVVGLRTSGLGAGDYELELLGRTAERQPETLAYYELRVTRVDEP